MCCGQPISHALNPIWALALLAMAFTRRRLNVDVQRNGIYFVSNVNLFDIMKLLFRPLKRPTVVINRVIRCYFFSPVGPFLTSFRFIRIYWFASSWFSRYADFNGILNGERLKAVTLRPEWNRNHKSTPHRTHMPIQFNDDDDGDRGKNWRKLNVPHELKFRQLTVYGRCDATTAACARHLSLDVSADNVRQKLQKFSIKNISLENRNAIDTST